MNALTVITITVYYTSYIYRFREGAIIYAMHYYVHIYT